MLVSMLGPNVLLCLGLAVQAGGSAQIGLKIPAKSCMRVSHKPPPS